MLRLCQKHFNTECDILCLLRYFPSILFSMLVCSSRSQVGFLYVCFLSFKNFIFKKPYNTVPFKISYTYNRVKTIFLWYAPTVQ